MLPGLQRKERSRAEAEIESETALWFLGGARQHEAGFEFHPILFVTLTTLWNLRGEEWQRGDLF